MYALDVLGTDILYWEIQEVRIEGNNAYIHANFTDLGLRFLIHVVHVCVSTKAFVGQLINVEGAHLGVIELEPWPALAIREALLDVSARERRA